MLSQLVHKSVYHLYAHPVLVIQLLYKNLNSTQIARNSEIGLHTPTLAQLWGYPCS